MGPERPIPISEKARGRERLPPPTILERRLNWADMNVPLPLVSSLLFLFVLGGAIVCHFLSMFMEQTQK